MIRKIGVLGAGHMGKFHLQSILESKELELTGFYDPDRDVSARAKQLFGARQFNSEEELIEASEMVDVVTPTHSHFDLASKALKRFKHVFIEKPVTSTPQEALQLGELAREAGVKLQVGHIERFNPAFSTARTHFGKPLFIEAHRLSPYGQRGTDVSVVLDLMIHDIDIVQRLIQSEAKYVSANGAALWSTTSDIASARITFHNGCVVNLTASRISTEKMRKMRIFHHDSYLSLDFLNHRVKVIRPKAKNQLHNEDPPPGFCIETPEVKPANAILKELESFHQCIVQDTDPCVGIEDGYRSLKLACQIMEKIQSNGV